MNQECNKCGGTGWKPVQNAAKAGDDRKKAPQVARCECRTGAKSERLLANARIPKRYEHCSLESFRNGLEGNENNSLRKALVFAERLSEEYPAEQTGLLLVGDVGVGKTHLAVSIVRKL